MNGIIEIGIWQFASIYLLLLIVMLIMKKAKINQTKLLIIASIRMSVQLVLAGFILVYIFDSQRVIWTILYLVVMLGFAVGRILHLNKDLNISFKIAITLSLVIANVFVVLFFLVVVVQTEALNPQYVIPISGMIVGNAMTGITLGIKTFKENVRTQKDQVTTLLNLGVKPQKILLPFANGAMESAILPTINSMLGMGIIFLPGMMTGQILSGTSPNLAILYQIAIMIAICATVCISVFGALHFGYKTLYNKQAQLLISFTEKKVSS